MYVCLYIQRMLITMLCVLDKLKKFFISPFFCVSVILYVSVLVIVQMCDITVIINRIGVSI